VHHHCPHSHTLMHPTNMFAALAGSASDEEESAEEEEEVSCPETPLLHAGSQPCDGVTDFSLEYMESPPSTGSVELVRQLSRRERARRERALSEEQRERASSQSIDQELAAVRLDSCAARLRITQSIEAPRRASFLPGGDAIQRTTTVLLGTRSRSEGCDSSEKPSPSRGQPRSRSDGNQPLASLDPPQPPLAAGNTLHATLSSSSPVAGPALHERAVTVEWLVDFCNRHRLWDKTTLEVVVGVVKPLTKERLCRFVDLEEEVPAAVLGHVDCFLSHCWKGCFGDLVAAALHHSRPGRRYWLDILAVNQHTQHTPCKVRRRKGKCLGLADGFMMSVSVMRGSPVRLCISFVFVPCVRARSEGGPRPVPLGGRRSNVQGSAAVSQQADDLSRLSAVVAAAPEGTTLVLNPRAAMDTAAINPLRRAWCVEEVRATLQSGRQLMIRCGSSSSSGSSGSGGGSTAMHADCGGHGSWRDHGAVVTREWRDEWSRASMERLVRSVDVRQAEATDPTDLEKIMRKMAVAGFEAVNAQVVRALWVAYSASGLSAYNHVVQGAVALRLALASGCNVDEVNTEGWTALHVAVAAGNTEHVETLLRAGADVDARSRCKAASGWSAAYVAVWQGNVRCLALLRRYGADMNAHVSSMWNCESASCFYAVLISPK
jgi:hypothetical protein